MTLVDYYSFGRTCKATLYTEQVQRLAPQTDTAHVVRGKRAFTIVARWLYRLIQPQDAGKVHLVTQRALRSAGLEVDAVLFLKAALGCAFWDCAGPSLSGGVLGFGWRRVGDRA